MPNRFTLSLLSILLLFSLNANAQSGCPGCAISLPALPADTIYTDTIPNGQFGQYYDQDVSFRMPMSTDPVNAVDPDIPPGISLNDIKITSITGLPAGVSWELSQAQFNPQEETDGCIRLCGTPLQSGLFFVDINLEAQIFILTQETSFSLQMYIAPAVSTTDGFTMINGVGCGELTVSFQNNIPSDGQDGYSYFWDFDNGYFTTDENPFDQFYSEAGTYEVTYEAVIDTVGYLLSSITLTESGCTDIFSQPDYYMHVKNQDGEKIFTSAEQTNASLPLAFNTQNLFLEPGQYTIEIWDEDGGIDGSDDFCGAVPFTHLTEGTIDIGPLAIEFNIAHPTTTITASDMVIVHETPSPPEISLLEGALEHCPGEEVTLASSYASGNQWFQDTAAIFGADSSIFTTTESGLFYLLYTDSNGCSAWSETLEIIELEAPVAPIYYNYDNLLVMDSTLSLPTSWALQWYFNGVAIEDATEPEWCAEESGEYTLEITDEETICTNSFTLGIPINPNGNCVTSLEDLFAAGEWQVFPNPTEGALTLDLGSSNEAFVEIQLINSIGKVVLYREVIRPAAQIGFDLSHLPSGMYWISIKGRENRGVEKVVLF
jgi:hypothetical protein